MTLGKDSICHFFATAVFAIYFLKVPVEVPLFVHANLSLLFAYFRQASERFGTVHKILNTAKKYAKDLE